jgi:hypothetical protein
MAVQKHEIADFAALRSAFEVLAEIWRTNGVVAPSGTGVKISNIRRDRWKDTLAATTRHGPMIKQLIQGSGQRASVSGRREVVLAVVAEEKGGHRYFEIAAILVIGRGAAVQTISLTSRKDDWSEKLRDFVDWEGIDAIIPAAEGNNQRAMIGLALQLAGIGRGRLEMVEADIPQEVEEAAQLVKGAEWMKAGLPRFESAAAEALWYLMRIRSVHARMIRTRKQGYYTAMALASLYASGTGIDRIARVTGMSVSFVDKLVPMPEQAVRPSRLEDLGPIFSELDALEDERMRYCAARVWRGAAIYAHMLNRRIQIGHTARERLAAGEDLVSMAAEMNIARRDLVRVLSVRQNAAIEERARFITAIIDPQLIRDVADAAKDADP